MMSPQATSLRAQQQALAAAIVGDTDEADAWLRPRADGRPYAGQISFVADRPGHDQRYAIDATKIETQLKWKAAETFETGIRKTVEWYLKKYG